MRGLALALLLTVPLATARAQPAPPPAAAPPAGEVDPDAEIARGHFLRGVNFYDARDYERALKEFEAARDAKPLPAFDFNIARCLENLGRLDEAVAAYDRFAAATRNARDAEDARQRAASLRQRIAAAHAVVEKPAPVRRAIPLWAPITVGAVAVVALAAGVALYVPAHQRYESLLSTPCGIAMNCPPSDTDGYSTRERAGVGLMIVAGALAAGDAALWAFALRHPRAERAATIDRAGVALLPSGGALVVGGRF